MKVEKSLNNKKVTMITLLTFEHHPVFPGRAIRTYFLINTKNWLAVLANFAGLLLHLFIISLIVIESSVISVTPGDALRILQGCSLLKSPVKGRVMAGEKSSPDDRHSSRVIRVVFLALLLDLLGFTVILPLLPSILDHYSETGVRFVIGYS